MKTFFLPAFAIILLGSFQTLHGEDAVLFAGDAIVGLKQTAKGQGNVLADGADFGSSESPESVIDENRGTKYFNGARDGQAVNSGFVAASGLGATVVHGIQFAAGGDMPGRDPLKITIEGSNSPQALEAGTADFQVIYEGPSGLDPDPGRGAWGSPISFDNKTPFKSYRVLVAATRDATQAAQYAEVKLIGTAVDRTARRRTGPVDVAALMPRHGTVMTKPAKRWEDGLAAGNGIMGGMLYGDPRKDTLLVNHCKLWLPTGSREVLPDAGGALAEMRRIIGEKGYGEGQKFFLDRARASGWGGSLVWTDAFHPGFFLQISQPGEGSISDYARVENFSTGEVWAQWRAAGGEFSRRMFISKTDNTMVCTTFGPKGGVSLKVSMDKLGTDLIDSTITPGEGWITCHNVYVKGKGGYDGAVRVVNNGGTLRRDGSSVSVVGADSVTLLIRILPFRTPLPESQAWVTDPKNPDFSGPDREVARNLVQIPGKAYNPKWMDQLKADLTSMPADYATLFKPHAAAWGKLFDRVTVDFDGSPADRALSSEAILDKAQKEGRLFPALLERMYDAGRYIFMCAAGPQTPPALYGIWTGTWTPEWSGDYTTDTNLQLDTELAYSANLAECMDGYYYLWNSFMPDLRRNAKALYGTRGIFIGSRASNNGLALHWNDRWPGNLWTPGTSWMAHWYYDHFLYTGDQEFLRNTAIPWMKDSALFWEDFLKGMEDASGHYLIRPSFSAENGTGDNTSQDIEIIHELLTNLIQGCEILGIEKQGVARWKTMLKKLPPLLINKEGQLKEWSNPTQGELNDHRHLMHLYGAFESQQFSEEADPKLFAAAKVALANRIRDSHEEATHGFMHMGLAAVGLGQGDLAFERVEQLAKRRSIYPSFLDGHFGGPRVPCDDGNGTTPEIINRMFVQSKLGRLWFLPAVPKALPRGAITGLRARGAITIDKLAWDMAAGTFQAVLTADFGQTVTMAMGRDLAVTAITVDGKPARVTPQGVEKQGTQLTLPKGKALDVIVKFAPVP